MALFSNPNWPAPDPRVGQWGLKCVLTKLALQPVSSLYYGILLDPLVCRTRWHKSLDPTTRDRRSLLNAQQSNDAQDGPSAADTIKIVTWNVQGLGRTSKAHLVRNCLLKNHVDICGMQESNWTSDTDYTMTKIFPGVKATHDPTGRGGTAILSPKGLTDCINLVYQSADGGLLISRITCKGLCFQMAAIYVPAKQRPRRAFMMTLKETLIRHLLPELPLILAGDFNFVEDPERDRSSGLNRDPSSAREMRGIREEWDLVDAWRLSLLKRDIPGTDWIDKEARFNHPG